MAGKINYSQQEKDAIQSLKLMDVLALNIKRIKSSKNAPDLKNYSIEVRQMLPNANNGFNELNYFNPEDPSFSQSSTGIRVSWLTIKANMAVKDFGVNSSELDNLPLDGGQTRLFIGKMNPSFITPDGSTRFLQLQKVAKLLIPSNFDPIKDKFYYDNVATKAKKAGANGRFIKGEHIDETTGVITAEYIIDECVVKSSTQVGDELVNDNWEHITIDEYVEATVPTQAVVQPQAQEQLTVLKAL